MEPRLGSYGGLVSQLLFDGSQILSLFARALLMLCLVRLSMKEHAWVLPLLATAALLMLLRSSFTIATIHHLTPDGLSSSSIYRYVFPLVSFFNVTAMLVAGFALKASVAVTGTPSTPQLVAAAGLRPGPATPVPPFADFLVGGILLAVGLGVTAVSLAAASNGGRYVVATGAIAVGVGRIVRGFIRLGRTG
jgi:hypothetical protein